MQNKIKKNIKKKNKSKKLGDPTSMPESAQRNAFLWFMAEGGAKHSPFNCTATLFCIESLLKRAFRSNLRQKIVKTLLEKIFGLSYLFSAPERSQNTLAKAVDALRLLKDPLCEKISKNHTLQKLSSSKCHQGFSDIFNDFRRSCEALSVKWKNYRSGFLLSYIKFQQKTVWRLKILHFCTS